jgi:HlyD family secretion protein
VRYAAQTVENVVTYDVVVDAENPDLRLRPGMTANVTFTVAERRDVLRVPNAALRFRPPGAEAAAAEAGGNRDRRVLYVLAGEALRPVPVRIGATNGTHTEISEGEVGPGTVVATRATGSASEGSAAGAPRQSGGSRAPGPPRMF